jgi:hypothetical protein
VSADGRHVAAAVGRSILVWHAGASGKPRRLAVHAVIRSLAISPDGRFVASGDQNGTVRVWAVERAEAPTVLSGSNEPVTALAFSADGRRVLSGGDDGALRVWDWDPGRTLAPAGLEAARWPPVVTHDGSLVAVAAKGGRAWVVSGGRVRPLDGVGDPGAVSLSANGLRAAAPTGTRGLRVWDLASGPRPRTIPAGRRVYSTAVSPDGRWLASGEDDRFRLLPWPGTASVVLAPARPFARESRAFLAAAFSSDSRRVAGAAYNGKASTIAVWPVPGSTDGVLPKSVARELEFHAPSGVTALDFSPDGTRLLAAMSDGSVRVWNLRSGSVTVLRGHRGFVADAAFSNDGREIVSGGLADGTLRLWELDEGGKAVAFPARVGRIGAVGFTADGDIVASGTTDARIWRCDFCGPIGGVLARARDATARPLTPDERALYLHEG